jgi:hypothetical protein
MENKIITFESRFGTPEKFNSQFHMVKIYIAYPGKNRNGSIISKETFEKMIPSLYGIPVVGEWKDDKKDFGTHGGKIEISDEGIQYIETTKPYGFVDSSATVQWESVVEEDGTEREYLTTTAFLWTSRYPEALKVLENKNNQSMELNVFDGRMSEDYPEYFEILDGEFSALCILGETVEGCFESAKISQFNLDEDTFKQEFTQMVAELKQSLNFTFEGGDNVPDKIESMFATYNQKREALKNALTSKVIRNDDGDIIEEIYYWLADFDDEYVYVEKSHWKDGDCDKSYGRFTYSFNEESIEATITSEFEKMILVWLTEEENKKIQDDRNAFEAISSELETLKIEHSTMQGNFAKLETEVKDLREFKAQKDKEEFEAKQERIKQEKINHINTEYNNIPDDIKEMFIDKVDEYETIEDLDADICVYVVKNKVVFSKANKKDSSSIKLGLEEGKKKFQMSPYGDLF